MLDANLLTAHAADFTYQHHRPLVTLSYAQSLDGCLAKEAGRPTALSGEASSRYTHQVRAAHDAVIIGIGTLLSDDPRLTVRLVSGPSPQPVVLDSRLRLPLDAKLFQNERKPWVFALDGSDPQRITALRAAGARVFLCPPEDGSHIGLHTVLSILADEGVTSLMVEGGAQVITSFLSARLVDQVAITVAPLFLGGLHIAASPLTALRLKNPIYERLEDDWLVIGSLA